MAEYVRTLRCDVCKTLEEVPDFEGDPSRDYVMDALIARRHTDPSGLTHIGQVMRWAKRDWESTSTRQEVMRQLAVKTTGFDPEVYAADAGFRTDAMECWKKHLRVSECSDYKVGTERRLTPNTAKERKELGLPKYRSEKDVYLCDFCPAKAAAQEAHFTKLGLYK